jgi:hypothetical protein
MNCSRIGCADAAPASPGRADAAPAKVRVEGPPKSVCMAYTTYIQWISKFPFHVFIRNSMLHTNIMVEDNIMLKPEMY